jgi:hypothetical protein
MQFSQDKYKMMTEKTIDYLRKRAKTTAEENAVRTIVNHLDSYKAVLEEKRAMAKDAKASRYQGYRTSSETEARVKRRERAYEALKKYRLFLDEVLGHKSNPLVYYWVIADPLRRWDYYHGLSQEHMPFLGDEWKKKYIRGMFTWGRDR